MSKKNRKRTKKRLKIKNILILIFLLIIAIFGLKLAFSLAKETIVLKDFYLASDVNEITLYNYDEETNTMSEGESIYRGLKIKSNEKTKTIGDINYIEIKLDDDKVYYIKEDKMTENEKDVIQEEIKYVRTSVTVYKNEKDSKIESFIKKGNQIDIVDYDYYDEEGNVNMYKIKKDNIEGWVYGKYLVNTEEDAKAQYNENGIYDIHKDRKFSYELYGGKTSTLDYYPHEKVEFKDNPLLKNAKTMYLNAGVVGNIDSYLEIATTSGVNAIVVDIKDGGLAYPSEVAKEYSKTAYNTAKEIYKTGNRIEEYKAAIKKIKDAGIYAIGRIVVFNDSHYGKDHKEECIKSNVSSRLWPSAYSRGAWEYNVELAKEAVELMGFNEIQFDYVRFPEDAYNMSKSSSTDFKNKYNEEKAETIQNFLIYATDEIHKVNAYLSVDVFGECSGTYVTTYGQYWPAISNVVDVISSMPYTDHFSDYGDNSKSYYWTNPYKTMSDWAKGAASRQKEIPTPAIARTWITAYDTPYWNPTVTYDASKISDQAQALVDSGLTGGFITWNSASSLYKYRQIKSAFSKDYN